MYSYLSNHNDHLICCSLSFVAPDGTTVLSEVNDASSLVYEFTPFTANDFGDYECRASSITSPESPELTIPDLVIPFSITQTS